MNKNIIILCPSYNRAKRKWDLWRKNKILFTKARYNDLILWDAFGNTWQFVYSDDFRVLRGHKANFVWHDDFLFTSKEIEKNLK